MLRDTRYEGFLCTSAEPWNALLPLWTAEAPFSMTSLIWISSGEGEREEGMGKERKRGERRRGREEGREGKRK